MTRDGLPEAERIQHGFHRTVCGCAFCTAPCKHMPGSLDVDDLSRLCPVGHDVFCWAEKHLRALTDKPCPTLVPARQPNGHCIWLYEARCAVHRQAPYHCAFFDSHMSEEEVKQRSAETIQARRTDALVEGLYYRVWRHLCQRGLIGRPGDRFALNAELLTLRHRFQLDTLP